MAVVSAASERRRLRAASTGASNCSAAISRVLGSSNPAAPMPDKVRKVRRSTCGLSNRCVQRERRTPVSERYRGHRFGQVLPVFDPNNCLQRKPELACNKRTRASLNRMHGGGPRRRSLASAADTAAL
ncbi:hypothetical protein XAC3810_60034 [Xanthomonas citri pv. citri]|nr:hypothetical protein XAC3824_80033 [Xanthomonas citri pv. citri]CEE40900.1 hypothetical protein XAC902_60033 [Xanthomonas citri pv. citri]CEE43238.1 hypothetical protein XAC1083_80032 [Xanthomonas citri pv. citri]CEE44854.1 hypothetical protein XAC3810_60034 [Xanthomonas citri pv. citri]CEE44980.1 hypothetical protein XAC2911_60035 [Xanthomonas citri pv. citri]